MTNFMVTLALLVLVLATGCFTKPLDEDQFSSSTHASFDMRSLSDEGTTELPSLRSLTDQLDTETSTFAYFPMSKKPVSHKARTFGESESSESFISTTERLFHVRGEHDSSLNNAESNVEPVEHHQRSVTVANEEAEDEGEPDRRGLLELTTSYMPSFTSRSSDVAPKFYKSESSTQKYIGHLDESEEGNESSKATKAPKKVAPKSESQLPADSSEKYPTAQLADQKSAGSMTNLPSGVTDLEENTTVVTSTPEKLSKTTMKTTKEQDSSEEKSEPKRKPEPQDPLNQGTEPSFTEAPKQDN